MKGIPPKNYFTNSLEQRSARRFRGFTIVELLIVIVVIAILAAITAVSYRGVLGRAAGTVLLSDVRSSGNQLEIGMATDGQYPGSSSDLPKSPGTDYEYDSDGSSYCLTATSSKSPKAYYISSESGSVKEGTCPGHSGPSSGGGGGGGNEIAANSPIQNVTSAQCQALPEFTGSNSSAIRTVTDSRGGTTRTYEIAKLADGNCWMLTSLKLGSTSGAITLTPADSNVASNFTLPQLYGGTGSAQRDYDNPKTYGPVPGDTGSGSTNYGYLYNWSAATAGETRTTFTSGNAQHSICPANWRLPTGGSPSSDFGQLDVAFGGTGAYASGGPSVAKWQPSGPFRGSFSGYWVDGFGGQGDTGDFWSASAYPGYPGFAFSAFFAPSFVYPGDVNYNRGYGLGVRCLLN